MLSLSSLFPGSKSNHTSPIYFSQTCVGSGNVEISPDSGVTGLMQLQIFIFTNS